MQPIIESRTSHNFSYLLLLQARLVMSTSRLCIPYAIIDAIRFSTSFSCYTSVVHSRIPCCILLCPYWALCIQSGTMQPFYSISGYYVTRYSTFGYYAPLFYQVLCNLFYHYQVLCNLSYHYQALCNMLFSFPVSSNLCPLSLGTM